MLRLAVIILAAVIGSLMPSAVTGETFDKASATGICEPFLHLILNG